MFHHTLHQYLDIMLSLSMLRQGQIWRSKATFDGIKHVVKSQVTDKFTFGECNRILIIQSSSLIVSPPSQGISTNDSYKPVKKSGDSQKKLEKVSRELERLQSVVSSTGYMIKAKDSVKSKHLEQVASLFPAYRILLILVFSPDQESRVAAEEVEGGARIGSEVM